MNPQTVTTGWKPPDEGWIKVNVDGAQNNIDRVSTCGGVLCSHQGTWITGFTKFIGRCSVLEAELWGIFIGLEVAWSMECQHLVVDSDSADALKAINQGICRNGQIALLSYIKGLCNRDWNVSFVQIVRRNNEVADRL
ncbi:hypothetical protein GQ457_13G019690 [Hibiscus cannabinus]